MDGGWYGKADWRLSGRRANAVAEAIEAGGRYWATVLPLAQGIALVEVRSKARPHGVVDKLRAEADCKPYLEGER